ncbi:hypothetical protein [Almyronema epifaneia]|uniref:Uncharacterized protein n=1 Tax=Almyronema epifaneia S1 TaxID=2991925 RepID=A0ABW6IEQ5_9CYAN
MKTGNLRLEPFKFPKSDRDRPLTVVICGGFKSVILLARQRLESLNKLSDRGGLAKYS